MTSAWIKPTTGRDERADGQVARPQVAKPQAGRHEVAEHQAAGPDENQLDLFEIMSRAGGRGRASGVERPGTMEVLSPSSAKRDFLDVGGPDSDELRRLEESIRWLMHAGNMRMPPTTPLSPVAGLSPRDARDDSLILDPETLFAPRAPQRRGDILRGAAKMLLVSAIAAPTAYFVASWIQFPGPAASSDPSFVSTSVPVDGAPGAHVAGAHVAGVQVAALESMAPGPASETVRGFEDVAKASPLPEQAAPAPAPETVRSAAPAETKAAASEQPLSIAAAPPADPGRAAHAETEAAPPAPIPVAAPPKPTMRPEEIALMIERGRTLFDSGDLAAARLFFRRAANGGDAGAAIAMGATYDPEVLSQRFIRGIEADAREAQKWYDKARALGGTRIEMLAHR